MKQSINKNFAIVKKNPFRLIKQSDFVKKDKAMLSFKTLLKQQQRESQN